MDVKILINTGKGFEEQRFNVKTMSIIKQILQMNINTKNKKAKSGKVDNWKKKDNKQNLEAFNRMIKLGEKNPEVMTYYNYFNKHKSRNAHFVIMKQAVIHHMLQLKKYDTSINNRLISHVVNLDHTTVSVHSHFNGKQMHHDYNEVVLIMDKMIRQNLYPFPVSNGVKIEYEWRELLV